VGGGATVATMSVVCSTTASVGTRLTWRRRRTRFASWCWQLRLGASRRRTARPRSRSRPTVHGRRRRQPRRGGRSTPYRPPSKSYRATTRRPRAATSRRRRPPDEAAAAAGVRGYAAAGVFPAPTFDCRS